VNIKDIIKAFPDVASLPAIWGKGLQALVEKLRELAAKAPTPEVKDWLLAQATLWEGIAAGGVSPTVVANAVHELSMAATTGQSPIIPDPSDGQ